MKHFLFTILFACIAVTYAQSSLYVGVEKPEAVKRTTPYKAKPAPTNAQAAEKARIAKMEKELQEADAAFEKEEYHKTFAIYTKYLNNLDAAQCDNLSIMYYYGRGISKDLDKSFLWCKKAAEAGSSNAMNGLGICYYNGEGTTKNFNESFYWYKKAADNGHTDAAQKLTELKQAQ